MEEYIVEESQRNIRLDKVVGIFDESISRTTIQRMLEEGNILVNGDKVKPSYKVAEGDVITVIQEKPKQIDLVPQNISLDIIYEDKDILIINKEKGMCVHPGARKSRWYSC